MSADQQPLLAEEKFGDGPFSEQEVQALSDLIKGCPWRRLALPADHPVYKRLTATVEAHGAVAAALTAANAGGAPPPIGVESVLDPSSNMLKLSLELLSDLSLAGENLESCGLVLSCVGAQLDEFVAAHCKPTGHSPDDEILAAILALMMNVTKKNMGGADLLEMVNGRMFAAVAALTQVFRSYHIRQQIKEMLTLPSWRDDAQFFVACTRALYELSQSQTLFLRMTAGDETGGGGQTTDRNMGDLDKEYKSYLASFNKTVISFPVLDYIAATLDSWFGVLEQAETISSPQLLPYFQVGLKYTMQLVCNMLTFTSSFCGQVKDHLAKNTVIIQNVALPYICFALDLLERGVFDPETVTEQHIIPLALVVRTVSLVSYKIRMFRPWLRKFPLFGARLANNKVILASPMAVEFFALVVRFVINADLQDSIPALLEIHARSDQFSDQQRSMIAVKLTGKKEALYPINVFCGAYQSLKAIFQVNSGAPPEKVAAAVATTGAPEATNKFRFSFDETTGTVKAKRGGGRGGRGRRASARNAPAAASSRRQEANNLRRRNNRKQQKNRKRYALLRQTGQGGVEANPLGPGVTSIALSSGASGGSNNSHSGSSYAGDAEDSDSGPDEDTEERATEMRQVQVTTVSAAALLAMADQRLQQVEAPSTNDYVAPNAVPVAGGVSQQAEKGQSKKWFGVNDSDEDSDEDEDEEDDEGEVVAQTGMQPTTPAQPDVVRMNAPAPTPAPAKPEGGATAATVSRDLVGSHGEDLTPWRKPAPVGVPKQYLCALSRRLIDVPVLSPQGEVFDKATIVSFLKAHRGKNLCPVSGGDLYANDLVVDQSLLREINAVRGNYVR